MTSSLKVSLEEAEQDRHDLRYKLSMYKRENDRLKEQHTYTGGPHEGGRQELEKLTEQRDKLNLKVAELKRENHATLGKLANANQQIKRLELPPDQRIADLNVRREREEGGVVRQGGGFEE